MSQPQHISPDLLETITDIVRNAIRAEMAGKLLKTNPPHVEPVVTADDQLIPAKEIRKLEGHVSNVTLWRRIKRGEIPQPIKIHGRNYWKAGDYRECVDARVESGMSANSRANLNTGRK